MAIYAQNVQQATNEVHTYTIDYTDDLPSGGTVTAGTATHTPPSGAASAISVTVSSPYLYATVPALAVTGLHYIDVLATFNDSDKSSVRIPVFVVYPTPTARAGMAELIGLLRELADVGPNEYTTAGQTYWTDAQLQSVLDRNRADFFEVELEAVGQIGAAAGDADDSGTVTYKRYQIPYRNLESIDSGTAYFTLAYANGGTLTQAYTVDYFNGVVNFTADQGGTTLFLSGRSYDVNNAAADVWERKANYYARAYDVSTDNHSLHRSQMYDACLERATYYRRQAGPNVITAERSDTEAAYDA